MNSQAPILTPLRRHDIDWLRILVTFSLILFQAMTFAFPGLTASPGPRGLDWGTGSVLFLISQWYIPLAFLISGWSRKNPMQHQTGREAVRERFFRLGMPFLTGVLVLCPLMRYVELGALQDADLNGNDPAFPGSFPEFLLAFFTRQDIFTWYNLWFLFYLFVFSVVSWPFFSRLLGKKVTPMKTSPGWAYLPLVPLVLAQLAGDGLSQPHSYDGWAGSVSFLIYFVLGFIISRYSAYERVLHQEAKRAGVLGTVMLGLLLVFSQHLPFEVSRAVVAAGGWLIVVSILGLAKKLLERPSGLLSYLREAALPVYLLYQVPLMIFGSSLISYPAHGSLKLIFLLAVTLGTTLPFHHLLIRKSPLLRLFFGVKREREHTESWKDQAMHRDRG
jgi:glucans biosynthesis protein C